MAPKEEACEAYRITPIHGPGKKLCLAVHCSLASHFAIFQLHFLVCLAAMGDTGSLGADSLPPLIKHIYLAFTSRLSHRQGCLLFLLHC